MARSRGEPLNFNYVRDDPWLKALGYTHDQATRLNIFDVIHPDWREHCEAAFRRLMAGETIGTIETGLLTSDGRTIIVEGSTSCAFENGKPVSTRGIFRDITERKRAEGELRESRALLKAIIEGTTNAIAVTDMDGRFVLVNSTVAGWLGSPAEDLVGRLESECHPPEVSARIIEDDRRVLAGEDTGEFENTIVIDGTSITYAATKSVLRDERGEAVGLIGVAHDITRRKQAEEALRRAHDEMERQVEERTAALRESEARYSDLYDQAPDMYASVDALTAKIVRCNQTIAAALGYSKNEIVGRSVFDLYHPNCMEDAERAFQAFVETGEVRDAELQLRRKDGSRIDVSLNVSAIRDEDGKILYSRSCWRDITQRKKSESARRRSEARLAEAQRIARFGSWDWNVVSNELHWSDEIYRIFGLKPQEFGATYEAFLSAVHPDDREFVSRSVDRALKERKPYSIDHRIILPDGEIRTVHEQAEVSFDETDAPVRMVGTVQDITERKAVEADLRESEERFRQLAENIDQVFWLTDWTHKELLYVSPAYEKVFGLSCESLYADRHAWLAAIHEEDRERVADAFASGAEQVRYVEEEYRIVRPDGEIRWIRDRAYPVTRQRSGVQHIVGIGEDITERKAAQQALRESESRFRAIVESTPECVKLVAADGTLQEMNPAGLVMVEADSFDQLRGASIYDLIAPPYRRAFMEMNKRVFSGRRETLEFEIIGLKGARRWLETHAVPLWDSSGAVRSQLAVTRDVTDRKQAEFSLREGERRLFLLKEVAVAANAAETPDDALRVALDRICEFTGWPVGHVYRPADDGTGELKPTDIWHFDDSKRFEVFKGVTERTRFAPGVGLPGRVLQSREPTWIADVAQDPNFPRGRLAPNISIHAAFGLPVMIEDEVVAVLEFFSPDAKPPDQPLLDVMAQVGVQLGAVIGRKRSAVDLRASEQRFRELIESSPDAIILTDTDGIMIIVNAQAEAIFGYTRDELLGRSVEMLVSERLRDAHIEKRRRYVASPSMRAMGADLALTGLRKDGGEFPIDASLGPISADHQTYVVSTIRDVTEQKRLEGQLRQAQKMEAIGQLAGGVAHDFNNILTVIFAHVELMRDAVQSGGTSTDQLLSDLAEIDRSSNRAAALTRQLLTFSRRQVIKPTMLNPNRILTDMETMLRRLMREDIDLWLLCEPNLWSIHADAGQIEQVVMNLVINAGDAMPNGGKVTVESSNVTLDEAYKAEHTEAQSGRHVLIAVSDNGCGMDEQVRGRVFEPFFTTKGVGEGTGLGLATVHGIVKQAGGHVTVYSEPGHGSTFKVYLPARTEAAEVASPSASERIADGGTETVLVCEDDEAVRELTARALRKHGYHVLPAENAAEALEASTAHPAEIHLLVTDVIMPGLNGRQLAAALQQKRSDIRVLYISGYTANVIAQHGVLEEGVEFLGKPFSSTELLRQVRNVLDKEREPVDGR